MKYEASPEEQEQAAAAGERAEVVPRASEAYLAAILDAAADGIIALDHEQRIVLLNQAAEEIFGYRADQVLGQPMDLLLPERYVQAHRQHVKAFAAAPESSRRMGSRQRVRGRRRDGTEFPAEVGISRLSQGGETTFIAIVRDVSQRQQAEEAFRESEQRFRRAFEHAAFGMALVGTDGRFVQVNPSLCRMLGYSEEELLAHAFQQLTSPDDLPASLDLFRDLMAGRRDYGWLEKRYIHKSGRVTWALLSSSAVRDPQGRTLYLISQVQDISERKRAEATLIEREAQYRGIFEATSDGLIIARMDGQIIEANPAICAMYGYEYDELINMNLTALVHVDYHPLVAEMLEKIQSGQEFVVQAVDRRKDGSPFHVEIHGSSLVYAGQPHLLSVVRDVTERVRAVQLLEQRVEGRTRELSALLDVSRNIASTLELESLLDLILDQLKTVVDYDSAALFALEGGELVPLNDRGPLSREQARRYHAMATHIGVERCEIQDGEPVIVTDVRGGAPLARILQEAAGGEQETVLGPARSWMCVPLVIQERVVGMLSLSHRKANYYTPQHAGLARAIASQAATAIENAQLYEQAQRLAVLEERQRLARELHDSVSQALYGIGLGARTARTLLDRDPSRAAEPLDYVLSLAEAALAEMRALIFELRPDSLREEGLVAALVRQAAVLRASHHLEVQTEFGDEPELSFQVKEGLYRIAQEALNNVAKHARASRVCLRLEAGDGQIVLAVEDNGIGFDPLGEYPGHMGLHSMHERAEKLGATLALESAPGEGTRLQLRVRP
jgi:PAS domain S-box-containing protein